MVAPWRPRRAVVLALVVLAAVGRRSEALELFVRPARATHGAVAAPAADGSNDRPFTSLTQARDAVRRWRRAGSGSAAAGNATVHLVPGLYTAREGVPLTLTAEDGGAPDAWTHWKAWDPADPPRLSAGVAVPSHLFRPSAHDSRVLVANLTGLLDDTGAFGPPPGEGSNVGSCFHNHSELFFDGLPQTVARWPNEFVDGSAAYAGVELRRWARAASADVSSVDPPYDEVLVPAEEDCPALKNAWQQQGTGWMHGYWDEDWADRHVKLQSVTANGTLRMLCQHPRAGAVGCQKVLPGARWYAQNLLSECDSPGEYFVDRERRLLYFYPPSPIDASADAWAPHTAILGGGASAACYPNLTSANGRPCGGNDNTFAFNTIEHIGYESTDTGAFYTDGPGGQAWVNRGNVLAHNHFRHIRTAEATPVGHDTHLIPSTLQGVYLDDLISGWAIVNNSFDDCEVGILMGGGRQNVMPRTRGNSRVASPNSHVARVATHSPTVRKPYSLTIARTIRLVCTMRALSTSRRHSRRRYGSLHGRSTTCLRTSPACLHTASSRTISSAETLRTLTCVA